MIADFIQDLRFGARMLAKQPGFTLIAVLTLALGIGANTAIFSVVNAVLLRPLPFADDAQLVTIWGKLPVAGIKWLFTSPAEFADYRERTQAFAQVGAYGGSDFTLTGRGEAERLTGAIVSQEMLPLLGVQPMLGWIAFAVLASLPPLKECSQCAEKVKAHAKICPYCLTPFAS